MTERPPTDRLPPGRPAERRFFFIYLASWGRCLLSAGGDHPLHLPLCVQQGVEDQRPVVAVSSIHVEENSGVVITNSSISVLDQDTPENEILFTIIRIPSYGGPKSHQHTKSWFLVIFFKLKFQKFFRQFLETHCSQPASLHLFPASRY